MIIHINTLESIGNSYVNGNISFIFNTFSSLSSTKVIIINDNAIPAGIATNAYKHISMMDNTKICFFSAPIDFSTPYWRLLSFIIIDITLLIKKNNRITVITVINKSTFPTGLSIRLPNKRFSP